MTRQTISTGIIANDGTGDTLRSAAFKINQNFAEIYTLLGGDSVYLSDDISFEDSAIVFAGSIGTTRLAAVNPASDVVVHIPNEDGIISLISSTETLTNKTLASPILNTPVINTSINDTNGNELIKIAATSSAVNEVTITNASTGNDPSIEASGETSRNLYLKGASTTGQVLLQRAALETADQGSSATLNVTTVHTFFDAVTPTSVSVPNGTAEGQIKIITSRKSSSINLIPTGSNIAGVTTAIILEQNESVQLLWSGSLWYIIAGYGQSIS